MEHLGARLPFEFVDSTFSRGRRPVLGWVDYGVRGFVRAVQLVGFLLGVMMAWVSGDGNGDVVREKRP